MSTFSKPRTQTFFANGAITAGQPVKAVTDDKHVTPCTAASDKVIGIAMNTTTTLGDVVEVAINGGGAKALADGTIAMGDVLVADGTGVIVSTTTGDRIVGVAMQAAVSGDLFWMEVALGLHY
jgi:hypothetical protein